MGENGRVDWYGDDVLLAVDGATNEFVSQIAFMVEGEAKVGAPVDTGFMRNAIYAITPLGQGAPAPSGMYRSSAEGRIVERRRAESVPELGEGEAAVHAAAEYTIFQEMAQGFLYRALEKAQGFAGGVIESVGREWFG